jgi:cytochrome c553
MKINPRWAVWSSFALLMLLPAAAWGQTATPQDAARLEFFEKKIRPLLVSNCYNCHSANTNSKGGLRVDDRNGLLTGGGRGPAVVPGDPDKSLLIQAVRHTHKTLKMPLEAKHLAEGEIADLARWIRDGAVWPREALPASVGKYKEKYDKLRKEHWAFQPVRDAKPPAVKNVAWPRGDVDRFILAGLEAKGLPPAKDADRGTLIRRVTFDLTGLPPTPAEIDAFVGDPSADALAKVVDRLLASSAYGERWGRHWLDLARYAESTGPSRNIPYPHAWRYRDYVIDAFNHDKLYDRFLCEQIAGDLLPTSSPEQHDEFLVATGFLAIGAHDVNQRFKVRFIMDNVDEQIDTVTRSVLALTASCARCHDHKFDPIPTTDYYALAGIFRSTDLCAGIRNKMGGGGLDYYDTAMLLRLGSGEPRPEAAEKIAKAKAAYDTARADFDSIFGTPEGKAKGPDGRPKQMVAREKMDKLQKEWVALTDPALNGPVALGVRDAKTVADTEIRIRGEAEKLGPIVPRGFLSLIDVPDTPKVNANQSGRLELAHWLTSPKNPLTPRVMANRVWKHLFGQGLVSSVDNFGVTGAAPSHPELLDYLAVRFSSPLPFGGEGPGVRGGFGWSIKKLVRSLVLSRTYQLSAETTAAHLAADPGNRLVWRHSPRRLDAEEIRDAMLAVSGKLSAARPKGSPAQDMKVIELTDTNPLAKKLQEAAATSFHRSIYLPLLRGLTPRALEVFDFAEQGLVTGSRDSTTVATQALYLLNDAFVRQQALGLAQRIQKQSELDDAGRIDAAYRLALGRSATAKEIDRARGYIAGYEEALRAEPNTPAEPREAAWASFCQAVLASAEFRYIR